MAAPPEEYIKVMGKSYILMAKITGQKNTPTTEDVRAMVISCHISSEHDGWRPEVEGEDTPTPDVEGQEGAQGTPQEAPPPEHPEWQQPNPGFSYDSPHPVSENQKDMIERLLVEATKVVDGNAKKGLVQAEKVVKSAICETFEVERGHKANITSFTRMTSGDASWVIDFLQRRWSVR